MRPLLVGLALALCLSAHLSNAAPAGTEVTAEHQQQETLETLHLGEPGSDDTTVRDKRTIGPLRQLFPGISQIVDRKIQQITRSLFRVIGRLVLGGGAGGNSASAGASSTSGGSGRKVSITLPTYPPGEDDDDDEEDEDSTPASTSSPADESSTPAEAENQLAGSESQISEVRVQLGDKQSAPVEAEEEEEEEDLKPAASGDNLAEAEEGAELENEAEGTADDENRNKRFLPFNLGGAAGGSGGSSAGSGNFLFDIIRLIAGSGTTQTQDEAENAPLDGSTSSGGVSASASASANAEGKDDGYQEGVPGPITRLFVIANRGIANLVQDLILRLAQTSERLVNFKARLITSII
ncbi:E3 ubiquitin-protein ligase HECW2-like isoform X2 [Thrips palmi]|nr:E3 ubiquitin-protein ligase HECW2-like isoform X2 [Thrips palmi]